MAKLETDGVSLEIHVTAVADWSDPTEIEYSFQMEYKGIPLVSKKLMNSCPMYGKTAKGDEFFAYELDSSSLLETLKKAMSAEDPVTWQSWPDPDVSLVVYPEREFPFLNRESAGWYALIVKVDTFQLVDSESYSGNGPALVLSVEEADYIAFVEALAKEYEEKDKNSLFQGNPS